MRLLKIRSIRGKLFVGIVGVVVMYVLMSWVLNWQLLDVYYHRVKTSSLINNYRHIRQLYERNDATELLLGLETLERKEGLVVVVVDADFGLRYSTMPDRSSKYQGPTPAGGAEPEPAPASGPAPGPVFAPETAPASALAQATAPRSAPGQATAPGPVSGQGPALAPVPAPAPRPAFEPFPSDLLRRATADLEKDYQVMGHTRDDRLKLDFISLVGVLSDGGYVFLRTPLAPIRESASAANRFFLISGAVMVAAGSVAAYWYAARFTKPVEDMKVIAEKVARLDFTSEYSGASDDEIGALGMSINTMSRKLEATIGELMQANECLQRDIQRERQIDEMRKEFIANVSHELKTPIALIQGYAEGLKLNVNDDAEDRT
ncbi:MAG: histidine kinase dimerization/phospho-acceptor domain-containing protein, partial [Clostridia bacterium]|nr:histidine kinase dimerization/phospho-acceptor domain-containing protein [Clostridia bacterium]